MTRWPTALLVAGGLMAAGCRFGPQVTRLEARPMPPIVAAGPGEYTLDLATRRLGDLRGLRDGMLVIPQQARAGTPLPLIVLLHGGGGRAADFRHVFPLADEYGVVMLALDSRDNTWDGIDSAFGPDVRFLNAALRHTFERVAVDPRRIALAGLSDGGTYALSLGLVNGDLFTHLVAVSPGWFAPPGPPAGRPRIFVGHGTRDNVYSVATSRDRVVPLLKTAAYDVTYYEFDGPHWVTEPAAREALAWFTR